MSRKDLIKKIEALRGSQVITYICGDRNGLHTQIGEDAVRTIYEHVLQGKNQSKKLDLFLYSRGGDTSVPWRIISMLREHYDEINALVPYKAYSAATMICLGTDNIVMGRKAELGPIDPTLVRGAIANASEPPKEISVEDVSSYVNFIRDRAGLTDQAALATMIQQLVNSVTPLALGSVARTYSHIRLVAQRLLTSGKKARPERKLETIIETLCEKIYSHGHAIGRKEALEMDLHVALAEDCQSSSGNLGDLMWKLYLEYESTMKLLEPIDIEGEFHKAGKDELEFRDSVVAAVESSNLSHLFMQDLIFRRQRQLPQTVNLNVNLNLALPSGLNPNQINAQTQQILNALVQQAVQQATQQTHAYIQNNAPIIAIRGSRHGLNWEKNLQW